MVGKDTKNHILQTAKGIILSKGYAAVGLNEILSTAGVPKGSFYHYFKSKEDFGVELLQSYLDEHKEFLKAILLDERVEPFERIMSLFDLYRAGHEEHQCQQLCLVAKLGSEVSDLSESMRAAQSKGIKRWLEVYECCIREGQEKGSINRNIDAAAAAALIYDLWQGASVRKQIDHSTEPLENAIAMIKRLLSPAW
ncbi:MAG: TetR family transcriptional regulator [Deltaproteobacteria bacterium HGW-Deltaproteobacteria-19]|jgi:TetR/AcrR family transcriptional repressor of nem operon|nr:MAG: TetR family transcriptional regulator [Deltaproteobacteria bacterium HGW-Deltaproteobacteria-19]